MELGTVVIIQVVPAACQLIRGHELDDVTLGQVGRLVEGKSAVFDAGAKALHRL
jgi:hypothetical protein